MHSVYVMHIIYCILIIEEAREMKMLLKRLKEENAFMVLTV